LQSSPAPSEYALAVETSGVDGPIGGGNAKRRRIAQMERASLRINGGYLASPLDIL
jgi:hypothetical protein